MDFLLFLLLNAILFIRPSELFPELDQVPLYYFAILATLLASAVSVARQLTREELPARPISVCVIGLLPAVVLSHLTHRMLGMAVDAAWDFGQVLLYYLLLVGIVNTPWRLRVFLRWLLIYIVTLAAIALTQYHGYIHVPALEQLEQRETDRATGEVIVIIRLVSTGIFNDPNDLSVIVGVGMMIAFSVWGDSPSLLSRAWSLASLGILGYALALTQSRGGMLAFLTGLLALINARFGRKKAVILSLIAVPAMAVLFAGRQTTIDLGDREDTAQARVQLWSDGLVEFQTAPVFGMGKGEFVERVGLVAHNSYIHAFVELGFFGGTCFVGAVYLAIAGLVRLGKFQLEYVDPDYARLRPFMLGVMSTWAMGLYSLSRNYTVPTYTIIGLAAAYLNMAPGASQILPRFDVRLVRRLGLVGALVLFAVYLFVRIFAVRS